MKRREKNPAVYWPLACKNSFGFYKHSHFSQNPLKSGVKHNKEQSHDEMELGRISQFRQVLLWEQLNDQLCMESI